LSFYREEKRIRGSICGWTTKDATAEEASISYTGKDTGVL